MILCTLLILNCSINGTNDGYIFTEHPYIYHHQTYKNMYVCTFICVGRVWWTLMVPCESARVWWVSKPFHALIWEIISNFSPNKGNKACRFPVHLKFVVIYHSHCLLPTLVSTTCRGCYQLNLLIEVYAFLSSLRVTVLPRCRCGSCESRWWQHDSSHYNN